jgi:hypothetical protein
MTKLTQVSGLWYRERRSLIKQVLERAIVKRHAFWISERARSCVGATGSFSISMSKRNLEAKLQFDHDVGRMLIRVRDCSTD